MSTSTAAAGPTRDSRADWRDEAACRDADPEPFFPDGDIRSARAQVKMAKLTPVRACRPRRSWPRMPNGMRGRCLGNPHSDNPASAASTELNRAGPARGPRALQRAEL